MNRLLVLLLALGGLSVPSGTPLVRVGVFGLLQPTELEVRPAPGGVLVLEAGRETLILEDAQGSRLHLAGESVQVNAYQRMLSSPTVSAWARDGGPAEMILSVPGKIERRFRGQLKVTAGHGMLVVVVAMDREAAVASAVAAESPPGAPLEALKAQAVATRSFYVASGRRHTGFDFCDTTHCQYLREPPAPSDAAAIAARETRGLVLRYRNQTLAALFSASCGGRTRSLAQVGLRPNGYPYFAVDCSYCRQHAALWETRLDARQLTRLLREDRSESARLEIGRKFGWNRVPGNNYEAHQEDDQIVLRGRGRGHGVGLCQEGAAGMAAAGSSFRNILGHYFPNTTVATDEGYTTEF